MNEKEIDDHLVRKHLEDCSARLSPNTVKNHKVCLNKFRNFLDGRRITDATLIDIREFLNSMKEKGIARSTLSAELGVIRSFFRYIETYHHVVMPSLAGIDINSYPKARWEGQGQDPLTRNEVRSLIEAAENLRDTLIIAMLYYLGLRVKELALLKIENVDINNRVVEVIGKGNKPRKVPYSSRLDRPIHQWLFVERRSYVNCISNYFFPSMHDEHLRTNSVYGIVYKAATKAGIQKVIGTRSNGSKMYKVHPHILRHSYATHASDDDIPLYLIQQMMGHTHLRTTLKYAGELSPFKSYHEKFKGV